MNVWDRAGRRILAAALAVVLVVGWIFASPGSLGAASTMRDFGAFYCAGATLDAGHDPYLAEPLGTCERRPHPFNLNSTEANLTMPAPLPPFALAPFALLARLPYVVAAALWLALLLVAIGCTIAAMRAVTGFALAGIVAAFALNDGYASLALGQIAPLAVAAIALAGWAIARDCDRSAVLFAAIATLEPHVGLPLCAGLFVWRPRTRVPLVIAAVALAALSLAVGGVALNLEYLHEVLPAHALSEVANQKQLSLTYLLHRLGAGDEFAIRAGELWYAAMLVAGVAVAGALRKRMPGAAAFVAPAFTVVGGPFVHVVQVAAAIPAALALAAYLEEQRKTLALVVIGLAIPWMQFLNLGFISIALVPLAAATISLTIGGTGLTFAALAGAVAALIVVELYALIDAAIPSAAAALKATYDPHALAETSWRTYVGIDGDSNPKAFDLAKVPTLLGALTNVALLVRAAFLGEGSARKAPQDLSKPAITGRSLST